MAEYPIFSNPFASALSSPPSYTPVYSKGQRAVRLFGSGLTLGAYGGDVQPEGLLEHGIEFAGSIPTVTAISMAATPAVGAAVRAARLKPLGKVGSILASNLATDATLAGVESFTKDRSFAEGMAWNTAASTVGTTLLHAKPILRGLRGISSADEKLQDTIKASSTLLGDKPPVPEAPPARLTPGTGPPSAGFGPDINVQSPSYASPSRIPFSNFVQFKDPDIPGVSFGQGAPPRTPTLGERFRQPSPAEPGPRAPMERPQPFTDEYGTYGKATGREFAEYQPFYDEFGILQTPPRPAKQGPQWGPRMTPEQADVPVTTPPSAATHKYPEPIGPKGPRQLPEQQFDEYGRPIEVASETRYAGPATQVDEYGAPREITEPITPEQQAQRSALSVQDKQFDATYDPSVETFVLTPRNENVDTLIKLQEKSPSPRNTEMQFDPGQTKFFESYKAQALKDKLAAITEAQEAQKTSNLIKLPEEEVERLVTTQEPAKLVDVFALNKSKDGLRVDELARKNGKTPEEIAQWHTEAESIVAKNPAAAKLNPADRAKAVGLQFKYILQDRCK